MRKWRKYLNQEEARLLSEEYCKSFDIQYCEIYYVDRIQDFSNTPIWKKGKNNTIAAYSGDDPPHILIADGYFNPIGVVMHELTHHLENYKYEEDEDKEAEDIDVNAHGYFYQLAKKRTITWCQKNISDRPNWALPLKSKLDEKEMRSFRL